MAAQEEMSARGGIFEDIFKRACDLFDRDEIEESERLCRLLLEYADLGDYHKAGCHRILSMGQDNYVWHAEQAVDIYKNLFTVRPGGSYSGRFPPTPEQLNAQKTLLDLAEKSLAQARHDRDEIEADYMIQTRAFKAAHGRPPTSEELVMAHHLQHNQHELEHITAFAESYEEALQAEDDEEEDTSGDSEPEEVDTEPLPNFEFDFDLPSPPASSPPKPKSEPPTPRKQHVLSPVSEKDEGGDNA